MLSRIYIVYFDMIENKHVNEHKKRTKRVNYLRKYERVQ